MTNHSQAAQEDLSAVLKFLHGSGQLGGYWFGDTPTDRPKYWWRPKLLDAIAKQEAEAARREREAFNRGQRVGQYQAADRLYSYATTLWVFKYDKDEQTKLINSERVDGLLKDCERYLNHNRKTYYQYVKELKPQGDQGSA